MGWHVGDDRMLRVGSLTRKSCEECMVARLQSNCQSCVSDCWTTSTYCLGRARCFVWHRCWWFQTIYRHRYSLLNCAYLKTALEKDSRVGLPCRWQDWVSSASSSGDRSLLLGRMPQPEDCAEGRRICGQAVAVDAEEVRSLRVVRLLDGGPCSLIRVDC